MTDVDERLRATLERLPLPQPPGPDWNDVVARARRSRPAGRRWWAPLAAATALCVTLALATPIGGAIVRAVGDFSAWLSGQPGEAVSPQEQREFEEANARSWLGFPRGTQLRRLETRSVAGARVELLGFRAGETLCLRVVVRAPRREQTQSCAPIRELRAEGSPVRILLTDHGFGRGTKNAWYGVDLVRSPKVRVTAGIVADGVESVEFVDEKGRHSVQPASNAVLHVVANPEPVQRVTAIRVRTAAGVADVPFAPAAYAVGTKPRAERPVPGPTEAERPLNGGSIGWLERREPRGEPLDVIPPRQRPSIRNVEFGRVLTPSPGVPLRIAVTISNAPPWRRGRPLEQRGVCTWLLQRVGAGGGCAPRDNLFPRGPLNMSVSLIGGSQAFMTAAGLASDDVERITAFLANGERIDVPLRHNVFAIQLERSKLPGRLVAYDSAGRSIGVSDPLRDVGPGEVQPARGRAKSVLRGRSAKGSQLEILVGPSTAGGLCTFTRYSGKSSTGVGTSCLPPDWRREPVQLAAYNQPAEFVYGAVSPRTRLVVIRFADGGRARVRPARGFVLFTVPERRITAARGAVAVDAYDAQGRRIGTRSLLPPRRR